MAQAPLQSVSSDRFRRGFGLDPIKSDMPLGSAASLVIHLGILASALFAWQATPPIMPDEVIAVDMVSDTPSVLGENATAETAQVGEDTAPPSPLPETLPPALIESPPTPTPAPSPTQTLPDEAAVSPPPTAPAELSAPPVPAPPVPAPPLKAATPAPAPRPQPLPRPQPTAKPLPKPAPAPAPAPVARQILPSPPKVAAAPKAAPAAPAKKQGQVRPALPPEFDLSAASSDATGASSGGPSAPQLTKSGKAGRLGKAGGGAELAGDLEAALRAQLKRCWEPPADMSNPRALIVVISIELGVDGRLLRPSVLVSPSSPNGASQRLVVAIDNAQRAVNRCAPFNLPPDRYNAWRQVRFKFDPELMARR